MADGGIVSAILAESATGNPSRGSSAFCAAGGQPDRYQPISTAGRVFRGDALELDVHLRTAEPLVWRRRRWFADAQQQFRADQHVQDQSDKSLRASQYFEMAWTSADRILFGATERL